MELRLLDNIFDKTLPAVSFSAGGSRAYCSTLGVLRALNGIIDKIPYLSGISGSSWIIIILSHLDDFNLMFNIDSQYKNFNDNILVDLVVNIEPIKDLILFLFKNVNDASNEIVNNNILKFFDLHDKKLCRKNNWPTYIIGTCYLKDNKNYPIDITPEYIFINNKVCIHQNELKITNVVASSSYIINILPSLLAYQINIENENFSVIDGAYIDNLAICSLLRRKCNRIFATAIITINDDGTLCFEPTIAHEGLNYYNIFENWNSIRNSLNSKIKDGKICYHRTNVIVKENIDYGIESYECEILFYFVTKVKEFMKILPVDVVNSNEMEKFPNFPLFFTNIKSSVSLTKLQSYTLISLTEWATKRIIDENIDFFN